jgi:hypothetical protein
MTFDWKIILPLIGVCLGWVLNEYGNYKKDNKNDKRKLNTLLFNLLEIRYQVSRILNLEKELKLYTERLKIKVKQELNIDITNTGVDIDDALIKSTKDFFFNQHFNDNRIENLTKEVDEIIKNLSEIDPVLAYKLSGQYDLKNNLKSSAPIIINFLEKKGEDKNSISEFNNFINPFFERRILDDFDKILFEISKRVSRKTKKQVIEIVNRQNSKPQEEIDSFIDDFISKLQRDSIKLTIPKNFEGLSN